MYPNCHTITGVPLSAVYCQLPTANFHRPLPTIHHPPSTIHRPPFPCPLSTVPLPIVHRPPPIIHRPPPRTVAVSAGWLGGCRHHLLNTERRRTAPPLTQTPADPGPSQTSREERGEEGGAEHRSLPGPPSCRTSNSSSDASLGTGWSGMEIGRFGVVETSDRDGKGWTCGEQRLEYGLRP